MVFLWAVVGGRSLRPQIVVRLYSFDFNSVVIFVRNVWEDLVGFNTFWFY